MTRGLDIGRHRPGGDPRGRLLDEDLVRLPRQVLLAQVVPSEAGVRAVAPRETKSAPYREDRPLKSPSLDTMVKPCRFAYAHTAESSAAARPTART